MVGRKLKSLNFKAKVEIINEIKNGAKKGEIANKFGIAASTVSTIWRNRDSVLRQSSFGEHMKRKRPPLYENIDKAVFEWFQVSNIMKETMKLYILSVLCYLRICEILA